MKLLVCGGRTFRDAEYIQAELNKIHASLPVTRLIHGGCRGVDLLSENWARHREIEYIGVPAKWKRDGKMAGPLRNHYMLNELKPDYVAAFPGGKGTRDMVDRARMAGTRVILIGDWTECS